MSEHKAEANLSKAVTNACQAGARLQDAKASAMRARASLILAHTEWVRTSSLHKQAREELGKATEEMYAAAFALHGVDWSEDIDAVTEQITRLVEQMR